MYNDDNSGGLGDRPNSCVGLANAYVQHLSIFCPVSESIDRSVIQWMCRIVGYPRGADGYITSGGSTASVIAMAAARDARGIKSADYHK